jgi:hypothetical protein
MSWKRLGHKETCCVAKLGKGRSKVLGFEKTNI